jgi:hypothetical protein
MKGSIEISPYDNNGLHTAMMYGDHLANQGSEINPKISVCASNATPAFTRQINANIFCMFAITIASKRRKPVGT